MASRFDSYRMSDGKTPLAGSYFNPIWLDLDSRLGTVEQTAVALEATLESITNFGINRLEAAVLPLIEQARALITEAQGLIAEANAALPAIATLASRADLDARTGQADAVAIGYDAQGRVITLTETYGAAQQVQTVTYDAGGQVATVITDWDGTRRSETFVYVGGVLVGMNAMVEDIE